MDVSIERLRDDVRRMSVGPRPAESAQLDRLRKWVTGELEHAGWSVREHPFETRTVEAARGVRGINLIAQRANADTRRRRFCLGAHLDSRPETPGADDNASGVAALLEVARRLPVDAAGESAVDVELVVFDLEELGMLGGAEHAALSRHEGTELVGMAALEMIAYADSRRGSQKLPKTLVGRYPDTGSFIAVIGNQISADLAERFRAGLAGVPGLPVETLIVPENGQSLQASRLSDHSPFWDAGYSALMITDTSFLRNPHYHLPSDTPETLDYEFFARVTQGILSATGDILRRGL